MTHAERMKEIKEREQAATAGPWHNRFARQEICDRFDNAIARCPEPTVQYSWQHFSNGDFIAHARADIPYLVARVEELEAALGEAMLTMRDDADVFNRLTAIKEGRHE